MLSHPLMERNSPPGLSTIRANVAHLPLANGRYPINARILVDRLEADHPSFRVGALEIEGGDYAGNAVLAHSGRGPMLLRNAWSLVPGF